MTPSTPKTALVLGASGGFGHAVSQALLAHGWRVRALSRRMRRGPARSWGWEGSCRISWLDADRDRASPV